MFFGLIGDVIVNWLIYMCTYLTKPSLILPRQMLMSFKYNQENTKHTRAQKKQQQKNAKVNTKISIQPKIQMR